MADIVVEPANVHPLDAHLCKIIQKVAASAVTCGDAVYLDTASKIAKADADAVASAQAIGIVIGINGTDATIAAAGDTCDVVVDGPVFVGEALTLTIGKNAKVYVSPTAGAMDQTIPATEGDFPYIIGWGFTAQSIWVDPQTAIPTAVPGA